MQSDNVQAEKTIKEGETLEIRGQSFEVKDVKKNGRVILKKIKPTKAQRRQKDEESLMQEPAEPGNYMETAEIGDVEEPMKVNDLGMMITSAKGLRSAADFVEKCLGDGNHELMHIASDYGDGRLISGFIIPERPPKCPECGSTDLKDSPYGAWCPKCDPDAPRRFHVQETSGHLAGQDTCQNCGTEIEEPGECDDCSGVTPDESG